jgi:hypothetical protein
MAGRAYFVKPMSELHGPGRKMQPRLTLQVPKLAEEDFREIKLSMALQSKRNRTTDEEASRKKKVTGRKDVACVGERLTFDSGRQ